VLGSLPLQPLLQPVGRELMTGNAGPVLGTARVFRLTSASASPVADGTIAITLTNAFTATLPGHSVTTLELVR